MPDDCLFTEYTCGLLKVVTANSEHIRRSVVDDGVLSNSGPIGVFRTNDSAEVLVKVLEDLVEQSGELRIAVVEPTDEVFMVAEKDVDLGGALDTRTRGGTNDIQSFTHTIQLSQEVGARGFIRIVRVKRTAIGNVPVQINLIDILIGADTRGLQRDRVMIGCVKITENKGALGFVFLVIIIDNDTLAHRIVGVVLLEDTMLKDTAAGIDENIAAFPEILVSLVLAILVIRILVRGADHRNTVRKNKPVDGGDHMRIRN